MNSDTPRTDKASYEMGWAGLVNHAERLERELNAAKAELEKLKAKPLGNWNNSLLDYDPYDPT